MKKLIDTALQQRKAATDSVLQPQPAHLAIRSGRSGRPTGAADKQTGGSSGSKLHIPRSAHGRAVGTDRSTHAMRVPSDEAPTETRQRAFPSRVENAISANNENTQTMSMMISGIAKKPTWSFTNMLKQFADGPRIESSAGTAGRCSCSGQARQEVEAQQQDWQAHLIEDVFTTARHSRDQRGRVKPKDWRWT